ncbi:MAG: hypothetical protein KAU60_11440, partial [Desulfobacterales bacterium]|nr:hypothetical protein [Desulfobacterales bacterium]
MIEPNPVNLKQDIGLPGASEKSRKGKTGKEPEQMMPFACVMGNACRTATQKTGKIPLNFRSGKGKKSEVRGQKSGVRGQGSEMVDAPELLKLNLKNAVAVKGKGIAESSHGAILKGEATKDINPFMNASKGKDGRGHGSEVRGQRSEMADAPGLLKFSLKNVVAVKGKSAVEPAMTEKNTEKNSFTPVKSGGKNDIGNSLKHLGLKGEAKAVVRRSVLADEAVKESRSLRAADTVGQNFRNGKNDAALFKDGKNDVVLFKDGGLKKNGAGINNALVRGRR